MCNSMLNTSCGDIDYCYTMRAEQAYLLLYWNKIYYGRYFVYSHKMTAMKEHPTFPAPSKKKVLIVEDDGEMCLLLNILLDEQSIEPDHVKSLEKAVEYLQENRPSV